MVTSVFFLPVLNGVCYVTLSAASPNAYSVGPRNTIVKTRVPT